MTDARLQDGFRAHQAGDLDKAERLYRDILNADGKNFDALYLLGYVHLQARPLGARPNARSAKR